MPQLSDPRELFLHELRDVLYAENLLVKALPKMSKEASDDELRDGFTQHLDETKQQVENLKQVFQALGERPRAEKCPGMEGIKAEHDQFMKEEDPTPELCDLFLTGAGARAEHYEIAAYSGLVTTAKALGENECARLLEANLRQEQETLKKLEGLSRRLAKTANSAVTA